MDYIRWSLSVVLPCVARTYDLTPNLQARRQRGENGFKVCVFKLVVSSFIFIIHYYWCWVCHFISAFEKPEAYPTWVWIKIWSRGDFRLNLRREFYQCQPLVIIVWIRLWREHLFFEPIAISSTTFHFVSTHNFSQLHIKAYNTLNKTQPDAFLEEASESILRLFWRGKVTFFTVRFLWILYPFAFSLFLNLNPYRPSKRLRTRTPNSSI